MAENYAEINKKLNDMAAEMVSYNPADINNANVKKIQEEIASLVDKAYIPKFKAHKDDSENIKKPAKIYDSDQYEQYGNEVLYFSLVKKKIPQEVYTDSLFFLLGKKENGQWAFDASKASFVTALKYRVEKNLLNYYKKNQEKSLHNPAKFKSLDQGVDSTDENSELLHDIVKDDRTETPEETVINKMLDLGDIINKYKSLSVAQSVKNAKYFEGFFTFDTTKAIKSDDEEIGITACKYNDEFFPLLLVSLLEYLMTGSFIQIKDIIINPLRVGINLNKRGELLERFFDVSHPTLSKFSIKYDNLSKAVLGEL